MPLSSPQKIKLLKLYELLKLRSDEENPLSTNQLCTLLVAEGISCDRRTLSSDIDVLNANGYEVLSRRTRYAKLYYVVDRQFDIAEIKILIDAVQAASFITPIKTQALISKIFDNAEFGFTKITVERPLRDENGELVLKKGNPASLPAPPPPSRPPS